MDKVLKANLVCFTIGHSNYTLEQFVQLLKTHGIAYLIDIRSAPYSKYTPQFNKESIQHELKKENVGYVYMGDRLGGRYTSPDLLFENGAVDFDKVRHTKVFIDAISRVIEGIKKGHKLALMCSEKQPFDCHRFALVSRDLSSKGVLVKHILENGELILNEDLEDKLLHKYKKGYQQNDLFKQSQSREETLRDAYILRNKEIAYNGREVKEEI